MRDSMEEVDVAIVGGGPGGMSAGASIGIADENLKIKVFERASALKPAGFVVGLLPNAMKAIKAVDTSVYSSCLQDLTPSEDAQNWSVYSNLGDMLVTKGGKEARERYDKYGGGLFPVAWYDLQRFWAKHLPPDALQINSTFDRYEETGDGVLVHLKDGRSCRAKVLVGADGNLSQVRRQLLDDGLPEFAGIAIWRAMRDRPRGWPAKAGLMSFTDEGERRRIMAHALGDGRLTWNVAVPWPAAELHRLGNRRYILVDADDKDGRPAEIPQAKLDRCLNALNEAPGGWPKYVLDMLASTEIEAVTEHGLFYRDPENCHVYGRGRVTLLGDAAHLTAAALGQGTSQTMEDALELGRAIALHGPSPEALRSYEAVRVPAAGAVQRASVDLVKTWGKQREQWVKAEQRASEQFFSRTFEPMPKVKRGPAASIAGVRNASGAPRPRSSTVSCKRATCAFSMPPGF